MKKRSAFTLIELLIVVAILAVLSAIALPNFLEAQTRSKVARVKADMSTITLGLEAYYVDNNAYPPAILVPHPIRLYRITTPIAYVTTMPADVFANESTGGRFGFALTTYNYGAMPPQNANRWALASVGPDRNDDTNPLSTYPGYSPGLFYGGVSGFDYTLYDPTNGSISRGDIFRANDYNPQ